MCEPTTIALVATTAVSAYGAKKAGDAQAAGNMKNAEQMRIQIEQTKVQAMDEENQRRQQALRMESTNQASAAASGFFSDSKGFQNISRANRDEVLRDVGTTRNNASMKRGQMAGQAQEYRDAAHYNKQAGKINAIGAIAGGGMTMATGGFGLGSAAKPGGGSPKVYSSGGRSPIGVIGRHSGGR
jgi:hypothetical protein